MRLLILGATGLVGGSTLRLAATRPSISGVVAPTRTPLEPRANLLNPVEPNLAKLVPQIKGWNADAVVCALGTTSAKVRTREAFRYVDYELPVAFANVSTPAA